MHKIGLLYSEPPFLQFSTPSSLDRYKKFRLKISLIVQTLQRDWAFWNPRKLWVVIVLVSISKVSSSITLVMYFQPTSAVFLCDMIYLFAYRYDEKVFLNGWSLQEAIDRGLHEFVAKQWEMLGVCTESWVNGNMKSWALWSWRSILLSLSCTTSSVPFSCVDSKHCKRFQCSFVINYMNKCGNSFLFVCKKLYVTLFCNEIQLSWIHLCKD